jgi:sugar lactone lactonase YvrE
MSCSKGQCQLNGPTVTITSGDNQSAPADGTLPAVVKVHVADGRGSPMIGAVVTVTADPGAYVAPATTDVNGDVSLTVRVGRALKSYSFTATTALAGTSGTFTATAVAPGVKNIFTPVNVAHTSSNNPAVPGPGTMAQIYSGIGGLAVAKNGTLYIADAASIYALDPAGALTLVAGSGTDVTGSAVNGAAAKQALFNGIVALALDETGDVDPTNDLLYISDGGNKLVRVLDFASGKVKNYAGGSASSSAPYGDGGPATSAYVGNPGPLSLSPNRELYISDGGRGIRKVASSGVITTWMAEKTCGPNGPNDIFLSSCGTSSGQGCSVAWDSKGQPYVSGNFCGGSATPFKETSFNVVERVDANANIVQQIVGNYYVQGTDEGMVSTWASLPSAPQLAFDAAGNLYLSIYDQHLVRRIDAVTYEITTVAGDNVDAIGSNSGFAGDYQLASTSSKLDTPGAIGFDSSNNLYIADTSNVAVREVWAQGDTVAPTATLSIPATGSGTGQTVYLDDWFQRLEVMLTDAANAPITDVDVLWQRLEPGSGFDDLDATKSVISTSPGGFGKDPAGIATVVGRVGLAIGDYHFTASYVDIHGTQVTGSPATFTVTAKAPSPGTIFTVANALETASGYPDTRIPGPATFAGFSSPANIVAPGPNGSMYFAGGCNVYNMTKEGEISRFAGGVSCGSSGDGGLATQALLGVIEGVIWDDVNQIVYITDTAAGTVRQVDLKTGIISPFAGGGTAGAPGYGDGLPATQASLYIPSDPSLVRDASGNTTVYIVDGGRSRIWRVDPLGTIHTFIQPTTCAPGNSLALTALSYYSQLVWNADGTAYISGKFCSNNLTGGISVNGVARRATNGTLTLVAGAGGATPSPEGSAPLATTFSEISGLAVDSSGRVYVTADAVPATAENKLLRFTPGSTAAVELVAGAYGASAPNGFSADYVAAAGSSVNQPYTIAFVGGHLVIADYYNYSYRMVW